MRIRVLFLTLVLFSGVTFAQLLDDGTTYPLEKGEASDPLYGNRPARTMSQREYSQFYEREVLRPTMEQGILTGALAFEGTLAFEGALAFDFQSGEVYFCKTAPEPSSLSMLVLGGLLVALRRLRLNGKCGFEV